MKPHLLLGLLLSFSSVGVMADNTERLADNGPDRVVKQFQRV